MFTCCEPPRPDRQTGSVVYITCVAVFVSVSVSFG